MTADRVTQIDQMATSFGYEEVDEGSKQHQVNEVFHSVAGRYDVMNDLMSGGMHRLWKDAMVAALAPPRKPVETWKCLDVAGGTGDIAFRVLDASNQKASVTVLDINSSMLEVGNQRAAKNHPDADITFVEANAEKLPFEDQSFDAYTIAFGIRNVPDIKAAIREAYRVLKFGGKFLCLEFSEVDLPVLEKAYEQWSVHAIPAIGRTVTGDRESYQYLVESIRKFPNQTNFANLIRDCGFENVSFRNYTGGVAALHLGWKV